MQINDKSDKALCATRHEEDEWVSELDKLEVFVKASYLTVQIMPWVSLSLTLMSLSCRFQNKQFHLRT